MRLWENKKGKSIDSDPPFDITTHIISNCSGEVYPSDKL